MGKKTSIAWCDHTFNPVIGCTKIGPGCDGCYAAALDERYKFGGATHWGAGVPRYRTSKSNWETPLAWNRDAETDGTPHRVFCASLADVFDNEWPDGARDDLWALIDKTPRLHWLLVTKRISNVTAMVPGKWLDRFPANVRLLITAVNQQEVDRDVPKLLALNCKNGVSYEPAIDGVDWRPWITPAQGCRHVEWIVVGGESKQPGHTPRLFNIQWARDTVAQCKAASVPCFFKQAGSAPYAPPSTGDADILVPDDKYPFKDRAGANPDEWPEDLRVRQFPE